MNYLDYVAKYAQTTFEKFPLNDVDIAIINELGYLPFDDVTEKNIRLAVFYADNKEKFSQFEPDFLATKERLSLFEGVCQSQRYQDLQLSHYVNDVDQQGEKQFAAMLFSLPKSSYHQVVFRGTDDSIVGWKEDFQMAYMREIPAQRAAKAYLTNLLLDLSGEVVVSGHSKGGNLAVYASSQLPSRLQARIKVIYMLDAPGLHSSVLSSSSYQACRKKIKAIRPSESLVGIMLENDVVCQIVESSGRGISQHALSTWQIEGNRFQLASDPTALSLISEKVFKEWTHALSSSELKLLVDTIFDFFLDAEVNSLNDFMVDGGKTMAKLLTQQTHLDDKRREVLQKSFNLLLGLYAKEFQEQMKKSRENFDLKDLTHYLSNLFTQNFKS